MRIEKIVSTSVFLAAALLIATQTRSLASTPDKQDKIQRPQAAPEGERAFRQNCSRCHTAPESFPPQISGTIVRHMRVRANLSREDERAILKFLNP